MFYITNLRIRFKKVNKDIITLYIKIWKLLKIKAAAAELSKYYVIKLANTSN